MDKQNKQSMILIANNAYLTLQDGTIMAITKYKLTDHGIYFIAEQSFDLKGGGGADEKKKLNFVPMHEVKIISFDIIKDHINENSVHSIDNSLDKPPMG